MTSRGATKFLSSCSQAWYVCLVIISPRLPKSASNHFLTGVLFQLSTPERTVSKLRLRDGCEQELCARCLVLVSTNRLGLNSLATYEHGMLVLVTALATGRQPTVKHVCTILLLICKHSQAAYTKLVSHLESYKRVSGKFPGGFG